MVVLVRWHSAVLTHINIYDVQHWSAMLLATEALCLSRWSIAALQR